MLISRLLGASAFLALSLSSAHAQSGKAPWENYADRVAGSQEAGRLGDDLLGDSIALNDGGLSFNATDVSLPGNAGPGVQVGRSYRVKDMKYRAADGAFADWDIEVPSISGNFLNDWVDSAGGLQRCSVGGAPPASSSQGVMAWDFWHGLTLNIPGVGGGKLLASNGSQPEGTATVDYPYLTNDHIRISCLTTGIQSPGGVVPGEGFIATTPDGTKYYFDWMARHSEPALRRGTKTVYTTGPTGTTIPREFTIPVSRWVLLATRVVDRFGNVVTYKYANNAGGRTKLVEVRSGEVTTGAGGDGRLLKIYYNGDGLVNRIEDNTGREWTYAYGTTPDGRQTLTTVNVPGGDAWTINFTAFTDAELEYAVVVAQDGRTCQTELSPQNAGAEAAPVGTLTHPSGATGSFTLGIRTHGRTNVPLNCANVTGGGTPNDPIDDVPYVPASYTTFSLVSKSLAGNGLPAASWTYDYNSPRRYNNENGGGQFTGPYVCDWGTVSQCAAKPLTCTPTSGCGLTAWTLVVSPENRWTRYTYGTEYRTNEGQLLKTESGYGSSPSATIVDGRPQNVLRDTATTYLPANSDGTCVIQWGNSPEFGADFSECVIPTIETVTWQQGVEFVRKELARNTYAMPTRVQRFSRVGATIRDSRIDETTYLNDVPKWVIGLVTHERNEELNYYTARTDYHATSRLPVKVYWPYPAGGTAVVQQTMTYSAKGVLATVKDGLLQTTTLTNWYRGVPKNVAYPDGTTLSALVNDRGQITQVTDQNNFPTTYAYDARGLLSSIAYPSVAGDAWNGTNLSFAKTTTVQYGFPIGTWKRTVYTGTGYKETWFDALWRPRMTREVDSAVANTDRFNGWVYNAAGETVFAAYPLATVSSMVSFVNGVDSEYDALGRLAMTRQDWEGVDPLETLTEFLPGFQTRTTNPRGFQTVTSYQAFDDPSSAVPTLIDAPEDQRTQIVRDVLGMALTLTRTASIAGQPSVSRHYVYDAANRLCKLTEPETGATVMNYDAAGNVLWTAAGLSLASPNPTRTQHSLTCDTQRTTAYSSGRRVNRTYDLQNRLLTLVFPDNTGNQTWTYTDDGLPETISTTNNGLAEVVQNAYTYNRRRLPATETSAQPGAYSWTVKYGYNANGHLSTLEYPNGLVVPYAPNALGQPTQAGNYATGVKYFPNGAIREFYYGNLIKHEMWQNERLLPERSTDTGVVDMGTAFDENGNVLAVTDYLSAARTRTMAYDDLDRLLQAQSSSFGGNGTHAFSYDVLDNLRSWTRGAGGGNPGKDYATYEYDTSNRLTTIRNTANAAVHTYTWDVQGNLDKKDLGLPTARDFNFDFGNRDRGMAGLEGMRYDGHGRRASTWMPTTGKARFYMYALSGQLLFEGNETAGINSEHIYLGGSLVADVQRLAGGVTRTRYKHTDALGSPVAATTETGAMDGSYVVYEPFGQALGAPIDGIGYTGHIVDPQSGLIYMQQRYYDPDVGRFLSVDPLAANNAGGLNFNRYNYGANNPYRFTDPDGRMISSNSPWDDSSPKKPRSSCEASNACLSTGDSSGSKSKVGDKVSSVGPVNCENCDGPYVELKGRLSVSQMRRLIRDNNQSDQSDEMILAIAWKESNFVTDARAATSTATGLMMVTRGAASDVGADHSRMTNPVDNIRAGSAYLQLRVDWADGDAAAGLNGYGTGDGYSDSILRAESQLITDPDNATQILNDEIHR